MASYYNGNGWIVESSGLSVYETYASSFAKENGISNEYSTAYDGITPSTNYIRGDATYETNGWLSDGKEFITSYASFFLRGGNWYNASKAGAFYYDINIGIINESYCLRTVLVLK